MKRVSLLLFLVPLCLGGCRLFSADRLISIDIPSVPPGLDTLGFGLWHLELSSTSGRRSEKEKKWLDEVPDHLDIEWPKEEDLLILLTPPEWTEGAGPFPCGAYVPTDRNKGSLSYRDGASVSILTDIIGIGADMSGFNCSRFLGEMGALENPWLTDYELLARQLGRREMRSWYMREAALFTVTLTLPEGWWYPQYALLEPLVSSGNPESPITLTLPEGYACFCNPASGAVAEVQVDDHGEAVWMLTSAGSSQSMGVWPVSAR